MPTSFAQTTAELTIQVVEAVYAIGDADIDAVERYCDLSTSQAENALRLAVDLTLLERNGDIYKKSSPLVRFFSHPDEQRKASLLRVVLEVYEPFCIFRERLISTGSADTAAHQTKALLDLVAHREEIKDTLISLGTYTNAIRAEGGGKYTTNDVELPNQLREIAKTSADMASAEARIRVQLGDCCDAVDRKEVILPLSEALLKAKANQSADAVADAAKAVESFLARLADKLDVSLTGANGLTQKVDKFRTGNHLPKKLCESARYLAQIRNAADHGVDVDPDVGSIWQIQNSTGIEYVFVACSFIVACVKTESGAGFWL